MKNAGQLEITNVVVEAGDQAVQEYARERIAPLARFAPEPTTYAHVRVVAAGPHTVEVHANLDVNGTSVVAQAEAETATEAIDAVRDRLHSQLTKLHN
jgi:ribosomal subunit interface protein